MCGKLATVTLFILLIAGCSSTKIVRQKDARSQYDKAMELYDRGKYFAASEAFRLMIFNFSGVSYIDSAQYFLGKCYFNDNDYILASAEFRTLSRRFPSSELADDAQLMIGKCYYLSAPKNVGLDQSDTYTAIAELENFVEDFPNSPLQREAMDLLAECRAKLAMKTFNNGEQYFRMRNYESARIYLDKVVTDFDSPEWRGCALYLLARIDEKEGKYRDASAKLQNLIREFPGHRWQGKAELMLNELHSKPADSSVMSESR